MGLEGMVSKSSDRPYRGGRSPHWIKVKNRQHHAFRSGSDRTRATQEAHLNYVPFDFVIAPSGANISSCVYILIMRDSLYYFIALLCVAAVLVWLIFLTLGA
jgi:hypothetical protein